MIFQIIFKLNVQRVYFYHPVIKKQSYIRSLSICDTGTTADVLCSSHMMYMTIHTSLKLRRLLSATFFPTSAALFFFISKVTSVFSLIFPS